MASYVFSLNLKTAWNCLLCLFLPSNLVFPCRSNFVLLLILCSAFWGFIFLSLYCKHWYSVLILLFVTCFIVLVGDSLVPLLIIVKLFLWFVRPMVSFFHWRVFHVKQIVSLTCSWFFFCVLFLLVFLTYSYTFCGIYFHCLLFFYWVCYCVSLHQNASELCIMEKI